MKTLPKISNLKTLTTAAFLTLTPVVDGIVSAVSGSRFGIENTMAAETLPLTMDEKLNVDNVMSVFGISDADSLHMGEGFLVGPITGYTTDKLCFVGADGSITVTAIPYGTTYTKMDFPYRISASSLQKCDGNTWNNVLSGSGNITKFVKTKNGGCLYYDNGGYHFVESSQTTMIPSSGFENNTSLSYDPATNKLYLYGTDSEKNGKIISYDLAQGSSGTWNTTSIPSIFHVVRTGETLGALNVKNVKVINGQIYVSGYDYNVVSSVEYIDEFVKRFNGTSYDDLYTGTTVSYGPVDMEPSISQSGTFSLAIKYSSTNSNKLQVLRQHAAAPNTTPTVADTTISLNEDTKFTGKVNANDVDGDALIYSVSLQALHGTAEVKADGSFSYTPTLNYIGADAFNIEVNDGKGGTVTKKVIVDVKAVNDAPVASNVAAQGNEDAAAITGNLSATDVDNATLTYAVLTQPAHGTVTITGSGFSYTPNKDSNGSDNFQYTAKDASNALDTAVVTVTITPVDDSAVITTVSIPNATTETVYTAQVNGSDVDNTLSYSLPTAPTGMTIDGTGKITWNDPTLGDHNVTADLNGVQQSFVLHVDAKQITITGITLPASINERDTLHASDVSVATSGANLVDFSFNSADGCTVLPGGKSVVLNDLSANKNVSISISAYSKNDSTTLSKTIEVKEIDIPEFKNYPLDLTGKLSVLTFNDILIDSGKISIAIDTLLGKYGPSTLQSVTIEPSDAPVTVLSSDNKNIVLNIQSSDPFNMVVAEKVTNGGKVIRNIISVTEVDETDIVRTLPTTYTTTYDVGSIKLNLGSTANNKYDLILELVDITEGKVSSILLNNNVDSVLLDREYLRNLKSNLIRENKLDYYLIATIKISGKVLNRVKVGEVKVIYTDAVNIGLMQVKNQLRIFPNPVNGYLYLSPSNDKQLINLAGYSLIIFTIEGKVVQTEILQNGDNSINVSRLIKGFYNVTIDNGEKVWHGRFIKQ